MEPTPYGFVRAVTLVLATFWTVRGVLRIVGFARNWERRLHAWGMSRRWLRRQVGRLALRATVFDPVNVALACVLVALWVGPDRGWFHLDKWRGAWWATPGASAEGPAGDAVPERSPEDPVQDPSGEVSPSAR